MSSRNTSELISEVLEGFGAVAQWLDAVRNASDAHRDALGFVPRSLFEQNARKDGLFVLVVHDGSETHYAGHLMFERSFPRARIRQMFVDERFRFGGRASMLLDRLRKRLTAESFISIYARVAEDLNANTFWQKQRFYVQRSERGGETRKRQILVRCHELESPQLFRASGINEHNPLGLLTAPDGVPMFLLDMNVLFDLNPRRLRRNDAVRLVLAERMNFCRLAISGEAHDELQRTLQNRKTDPMEALLDTFPCFPVEGSRNGNAVLEELVPMVFPHVGPDRPITANERSDLRHAVTAVVHELSGLVTNDTALLNVAVDIEARFGIRILSAASLFFDDSPKSLDIEAFGQTQALRLEAVREEQRSAVRQLLVQVGLSGQEIATTWLVGEQKTRVSNGYVVWSADICIGFVTWPAWANNDVTVVHAAVDERNERALDAARMLLVLLVDELRSKGPRQVRLELPARQSHLREIANTLGFRGSPFDRYLAKFALGRVVTPESWPVVRQTLIAARGPKLPEQPPDYQGIGQQLPVSTPDGNRVHMSLEQLETLLSPMLFCLRQRPAVITPIQRIHAEPLLGYSPQLPLLPLRSTALFCDRHYLSKPGALRYFKRGALILFYESSRGAGGCQIVALARVVRAYLKSRDELSISDLKPSVLSIDSVGDIGKSPMKTVAVFDNIFSLPHPVGLARLRELGCGRSTDLLTTRPITDDQLHSILKEGFGHA
jgi:hypothetical protein